MRCVAKEATQAFLRLPEYHNAKSLSIFLSMEGRELSTHDLVRDAFSRGKQVFVPYLHKANHNGKAQSLMDMLALSSLEDYQALEKDKWGIPSIAPESVESRPNAFGGYGLARMDEGGEAQEGLPKRATLDLIVVPAVALDQDFNRLGHGKGYYDTFFSRCHDLVQKGIMHQMPSLGPFIVLLVLSSNGLSAHCSSFMLTIDSGSRSRSATPRKRTKCANQSARLAPPEDCPRRRTSVGTSFMTIWFQQNVPGSIVLWS